MHISQIRMAGFTRHAETFLQLPERGVVLVTGPNGSGKSSLIEAVDTGIWGKTLRGSPPWSDEKGSVSLVVDDLTIGRKYNGRGTLLKWQRGGAEPVIFENQTKAQDALIAVLGDFDVWRKTHCFSASDAALFTTATDAERKRLLEVILDLEKFDIAARACAVARKDATQAHSVALTKAREAQVSVRSAEEAFAKIDAEMNAAPKE